MDEEQIGDGINPSPGLGGLIDLGTTFDIDKFCAEEELPDIKGRDGNFGPGGEEEPWSFFQKNEKDL